MDEIFRKTVDNPADNKILKLSRDNSEQLPTEFYASDNKSKEKWKCSRMQRSSGLYYDYYLHVEEWDRFKETLKIKSGSTIVLLKKDNSWDPEADPSKPKATPYKFEV
ncbi:hypothetical protein SLE2022_040280 [Rubroshorea leprosula]